MVKKLFFIGLSFLFLFSKTNIETKIQKTQNDLQSIQEKEKVLHKELDKVGEQIIKEEKELDELKAELERLSGILEQTKKEYEEKNIEYEKLTSSREELVKTKKSIEKDIIEAIAKNLSFEIIKSEIKPTSENELLSKELFDALSSVASNNLKNLKDSYAKVGDELSRLDEARKVVGKFLEQARKDLTALNEANKKKSKLLTSLKIKKDKYDKQIKMAQNEQDELQNLLLKLNIIQKEEEENQKAKAAREKQTSATNQKVEQNQKSDVRLIGSSYHEAKTVRYSGKKTIAPLDEYELIKEFGPYFDPVYKIKVFNESVELKPKDGDAKVKSVFDGKVVFAKEMPVLDKVVIIEHHDNIHTIYARLSKIAPTLKNGLQIKKGYVIGRVDNMLTFEVTQKNYHINPMEIISF